MESKSFKISPEAEKGSRDVKIRLSGELSIQNIVEIKDNLMHFLEQFENIEIVAEEVESFDVSCVQIFYALSRSASHKNKHISYNLNLPEEIKNVIAHSGLQNLLVPKAELH